MARILVIDDNPAVRSILLGALESAGHEVLLASNGAEGLELQRGHSSDIVITDIIMPEKEGLETIRDLRQLYPNLGIIAMSGGGKSVSTSSYLTTAGELGAEVLLKPFHSAALLATVEKLLKRSSG
jgi:DNA-binding response OmpR family regulator